MAHKLERIKPLCHLEGLSQPVDDTEPEARGENHHLNMPAKIKQKNKQTLERKCLAEMKLENICILNVNCQFAHIREIAQGKMATNKGPFKLCALSMCN